MFHLLASYPKSGNTYVRIFLAHYIRGNTDLNKVGWPIFSSVAFFPLGIPPRRNIQPTLGAFRLAKTHEIATLYNRRYIDRAIYIVRNPVDVVPSWARHMGISNSDAVTATGCFKWLRGTDRIFPQAVGSWSGNVRSWLAVRDFPVLYIRYETLVASPDYGFRLILDFLGIAIDEIKFAASLEFVRFANLQKLEVDKGFKEARGSTGKFFNVGRPGNGKEALTTEQIERIKQLHGPTMRLLGYDAT